MLPTPLVSASFLADRPDLLARVRFVDARAGGAAAYESAHLHGAVRADLEAELSGDTARPARGGRHPLPDVAAFARTVGAWGVGPDTPVVVYDASNGALAASRAWWMLRALGHGPVAVLDGGLAAAREAGLPIDAQPVAPTPVGYPAPEAWLLPTVDLAEVNSLGDRLLLDVRAAERYRGEVEPIDPVAGHIPGATSAPLTDCLDGERLLPPAQLRAHLDEVLAGHAPEDVIVSCGSGVTACHTLLALEAAGLPGAALYVGSWSEWCRLEGAD